MVIKGKHNKRLRKTRLKKENDAKKQPEIDFDTSAYVVYDRLEMTYPCLSFDIVASDQPNENNEIKFPFSLKLIAGAQTPPHVENNYIYVMKVDNIKALKQEDENVKDEESDDEDDEDNPASLPQLTSVRVPHKGCVNRLRVRKLGGKVLTASWSEKGKVHIYDLTTATHAVTDQRSINTYVAQKVEPKPIFTFGGHLSEGFGVDWSPFKAGSLATGDCKKNIHIWTMRNQTDWNVDQVPLIGHEQSVEDLKWSPEESEILASCSVDKSLRLWDMRLKGAERCIAKVLDSHKSDVNVIDWNRRSKNFIVSGADDGVVKVWDTRFMKKDECPPVAHFSYHKMPITSVEWNPNDDTVMAVASEDDRLTLWDLAVEKDEEQEADNNAMEIDDDKVKSSSSSDDSEEEDGSDDVDDEENQEDKLDEDGVDYSAPNFKEIPEQMLFLHQGQSEIKELHWHPQFDGLIISTAANGLNIFKTISA